MKSVQSVKNSLKFKAQEKEGVLSVKIGVRKYTVPVQARLLGGSEYLFLSFPASSELYRVNEKELLPLGKDEDASEAYSELNPGRRTRRRKNAPIDLPVDLAEALRGIPAGYKLGYNADGSPKLVRTRRRGKNAG